MTPLEAVKLTPPDSYGILKFWTHPEVAAEIRRMQSELLAVKAERDRLLRHEYICIKCGLRKDGEKMEADF